MNKNLANSLFVIITARYLYLACSFGTGEAYQTFTKAIIGNTEILVAARHERCVYVLCGAYFIYEVRDKNRGLIKPVSSVFADYPLPINKEQLVVRNEQFV